MSVELSSGVGALQAATQPAVLKPVSVGAAKVKGESPQPAQVQKESSVNSAERLKEATEKINDFIDSISHDVRFTIDKDTEKMVVQVVERKSGTVLRQIPPEEVLQIAKALDAVKGLIIREKA